MREHGVADGGAVGTAVMRLTNRPRRIGGSDAVERMGDASATARGGWMGGRGCSSWMDRGEVEQQQQVSLSKAGSADAAVREVCGGRAPDGGSGFDAGDWR